MTRKLNTLFILIVVAYLAFFADTANPITVLLGIVSTFALFLNATRCPICGEKVKTSPEGHVVCTDLACPFIA